MGTIRHVVFFTKIFDYWIRSDWTCFEQNSPLKTTFVQKFIALVFEFILEIPALSYQIFHWTCTFDDSAKSMQWMIDFYCILRYDNDILYPFITNNKIIVQWQFNFLIFKTSSKKRRETDLFIYWFFHWVMYYICHLWWGFFRNSFLDFRTYIT